MNHSHVASVLIVVLDGTVMDRWGISEESVLELSIVVTDRLLLLFGEGQEFTFFLLRHTSESNHSSSDFFLEHWEEDITSVGHGSGADTVEGGLERGSSDSFGVLWVVNVSKNLIKRSLNNSSHFTLEIVVLKVLNLVEHSEGSLMERGLSVQLGVGEEVDKSSLLNEFVFFINSIILKLLLGVSQV